MQEVQAAGKTAKLKKIFNHRDGIHAYYIYSVS